MEVKRIALQGLSNTRDLGGISGESGAPVKERRLIRSGALFHGAGADLSVLREAYGVHTVIDLRTAVEAENEPDPAFPGWEIRRLPLLDDSFFGIARDEAIRSATIHPARQLGCADRAGSIAVGKQADFVICDADLNRKAVWLRGERLF